MLAVLLLLSFLLLGAVRQLLWSLLLWLVSLLLHAVGVIPAVTGVALVPDVDNVAGLPALLASLWCSCCSCCYFMPAFVDEAPVSPSVPILACNIRY